MFSWKLRANKHQVTGHFLLMYAGFCVLIIIHLYNHTADKSLNVGIIKTMTIESGKERSE